MDLVDLAGTESLAVLALKAVQAVPHPVPGGEGTTVPHARVVTMTGHGSAGMMIAQRVRVETMVDRVVRVGKIRVPVFVVTMIDVLVRVETIRVPVDLELPRNSARMKSATRVAVAA